MRRGVLENYKRSLEEFEKSNLEKDLFYSSSLEDQKVLDAMAYLTECLKFIDIEHCDNNQIVTKNFPLSKIPHWNTNEQKDIDIIKKNLSVLHKAFRKLVLPKTTIFLTQEPDPEHFYISIPTDYVVDKHIAYHECDIADTQSRIEDYETRLKYSTLELQKWKKLKTE